MASFNKFDCFVADIANKVHNLGADALKVLLTNTAPQAGDTVVDTTGGVCVVKSASNANEIAAANNYAKGGIGVTITGSTQTGGLYKLVASPDPQFSASGGSFGPFQYVVLYNSAAGAAASRPVIGWWNYGSSISLNDQETFTVDLDQANGVLTLQ